MAILTQGPALSVFIGVSRIGGKDCWSRHVALPIHTRLRLFEMRRCHIRMGVVHAARLLVETCDYLLQLCGALCL